MCLRMNFLTQERLGVSSMAEQPSRLKQEDWESKASLGYMVILGGQKEPK